MTLEALVILLVIYHLIDLVKWPDTSTNDIYHKDPYGFTCSCLKTLNAYIYISKYVYRYILH